MDTVSRVKNAKSPQDALVALAQAVDNVYAAVSRLKEEQEQPWDNWGTTDWPDGAPIPEGEVEPTRVDGERARLETDADGNVVVDLPPVTEEKRQERREFAERIGLEGELVEAYAKAGPLWLYYGNRQHVMGLPEEWRREMVVDVMEQSPAEAQEMGRDVLKDASPGNGPQSFEEAVG